MKLVKELYQTCGIMGFHAIYVAAIYLRLQTGIKINNEEKEFLEGSTSFDISTRKVNIATKF